MRRGLLLGVSLGLALGTAAACDRIAGRDKDESTARSAPDFGGVEIVEVEADGVGPTRNGALLDALNLAVSETNGAPIEGVTLNLNGGLASADYPGGFSVTIDNVSAVTRGAVKSFAIVKQRQAGASWRVTVKAKVAKLKDSAASGMPKVVVVSPRAAATNFQIGDQALPGRAVSAAVRGAVQDALGRSNRFAVIDHDFDTVLDAEMAQLTSGVASPAEIAKFGQRLTADIVIVPEIRRLEYRKFARALRYSGRELRSYAGGANITFNVLNVATGQLILSKPFSVEFPATPPTVLGAPAVDGEAVQTLIAGLADQFTREFIQKNFPVSLIKMDGSTVTLSQGEGFLLAGETYDVIRLGEEMTDPQTGQSLGRAETAAGTVTVTLVKEKVSVGSYKGPIAASGFAPGVLELRRSPSQPPVRAVPSPPLASPAKAASLAAGVKAPVRRTERAARDDFEGDFGF